MANNRLYIGNKETLDTFCLTKPDENYWQELSDEDVAGFNRILKTDLIWKIRTDLVLFSESDTAWFDYFFNHGVLPLPADENLALMHAGLPDDCINGWDEVKFCENRQGDGNKCKHCSHYA